MKKYYLNLVINEVKNFGEIQKQFGYADLDDLIAHYIEENVIASRKALISVLNALRKQIGILVKERTFDDWWG